MHVWPEWYAQAVAWCTALAALGLLAFLCGAALKAGFQHFTVHLGWGSLFWDWVHHEWLPKTQAARKEALERAVTPRPTINRRLRKDGDAE